MSEALELLLEMGNMPDQPDEQVVELTPEQIQARKEHTRQSLIRQGWFLTKDGWDHPKFHKKQPPTKENESSDLHPLDALAQPNAQQYGV